MKRHYKTFKDLDESQWLQDIEDTMSKDKWPAECVRCEHTEKVSGESIRTKSIERHKILHPLKENYLIVGGPRKSAIICVGRSALTNQFVDQTTSLLS